MEEAERFAKAKIRIQKEMISDLEGGNQIFCKKRDMAVKMIDVLREICKPILNWILSRMAQ
jgi:hypothetical protein